MKCSDKEWQHCNKEKMGCEGCFYNDEISIGEYVRLKNGKIIRFEKFGIYRTHTRKINGKYETGTFENKCIISGRCHYKYDNIVKHSKNIKKLLEIGDIITTNNLCGEITKIDGDTIYLANYMGTCNIEDIESIITKEQIKQIEYRIKE